MPMKHLLLFMSLSAIAYELPLLDPSRWSANEDGGNSPKIEFLKDSARFSFDTQGGKYGWGNSRLSPLTLPADSTAVEFDILVESADPRAAMHVWFFEADGDAWVARVNPQDGKDICLVLGEWRQVIVPFSGLSHQGRGNKRKEFMTVNHFLMGFNFGNQVVQVRNLRLKLNPKFKGDESRALAEGKVASDSLGRRVVILDEASSPKTGGSADPRRLASLLSDRGFNPQLVRSGDLVDPKVFNKDSLDLVIFPNAPFFPISAASNLIEFLKRGGSFVSIGGYPFDEPCSLEGERWIRGSILIPASEIDKPQRAIANINTRYGAHGDTMKLEPTQIGFCDPSFILQRTASAITSPDQDWFTADWRLEGKTEGPAAVAMTGSNSPVFPRVHGRYIPLIQAQDAFGRQRGPMAAVVLNHAGPFKGSNWAAFTATNVKLLDGSQSVIDNLFVELCERLLAPAYLIRSWCDKPCALPGETVKLEAAVCRQAGEPLRFLVDGKPIPSQGDTATWTIPADDQADFHAFTVQLLKDGKVIDHLDNGFSVWNKRAIAQGIDLKLKDNYFDINGKPTFFTGANTTGMMWFSHNENPLVWKKDFQAMRDFGINFLRILHFSPFSRRPVDFKYSSKLLDQQPELTRRQTDAIVQIAQQNQVAIFLSLHDWIPLDISDEDLEYQANWNKFWVGRYKEVPGIFYDVQNEPSTSLGNAEVLMPLLKKFLAERYGSVEAAQSAWQASGSEPTLDFKLTAKGWDDLKVRDLEQFRMFVFRRWTDANMASIKEPDPDALGTVGHHQGITQCDKYDGMDTQDFANVHHYGALTDMRAIIKMLDRRFDGKSITLGEFGSAIAHRARTSGRWGDTEKESVNHYLSVGHCCLGMGVSFMGNWSWKDFQDCVFPWGINHADLTPKAVLEAYRNLAILFRNVRPKYISPKLFYVIPDGFRQGPNINQIHDNLKAGVDELLKLNVPFGVINEWAIDRLPKSATALVWPLAYGAKDETFQAMASFVDNGGALLITGDPRFGYDRKPNRPERLKRLKLSTDMPPRAFTDVSAWPAPIQSGRVLWQAAPAESRRGAGLRELYRRFVDDVASVPRLKLDNEDGAVLAFDVPLHDGKAMTFVNFAGEAREVKLPGIQLQLAGGRTGFLQWNSDGDLVAFNVQGDLKLSGRKTILGCSDAAFVSLDDRDLAKSSQILAIPFGQGIGRRFDKLPVAEIGEFRNARWTTLSSDVSQSIKAPYDLVILSTAADRQSAVSTVEKWLVHEP